MSKAKKTTKKEKSETVLAKYNTILNYNKNIFI